MILLGWDLFLAFNLMRVLKAGDICQKGVGSLLAGETEVIESGASLHKFPPLLAMGQTFILSEDIHPEHVCSN